MLFIVTPVGLCYNLGKLYYTYTMAIARDEKVYIYEKRNSINPKVTFYKDILKENERFVFVDSLVGLEDELEYEEKRDALFIGKRFTKEEKHTLIKECLQLNNKTKERLGLLPLYDVAVHCRTGDKITWGEMGKIELIDYINEIKKVPDLPENPNIFLMTDNGKVVTQFKLLIPTSWKVFTFTKEEEDAYDQHTFNDKTSKQKLAELYQFLLETEIAKNSKAFIGTLSSNVGFYIMLTGNHTYRKSLDTDDSLLF